MQGTNYTNRARYFDAVYGYSSAGSDTALLYDSSGNDTFWGRPQYSVMQGPAPIGGTYYNRVKGFKTVKTYGTTGTDVAHLYDSTAPTRLDGSGNWAKMYDNALSFSYLVSGFKQVNAYASHAGNTKNVSAIEYLITYYGSW